MRRAVEITSRNVNRRTRESTSQLYRWAIVSGVRDLLETISFGPPIMIVDRSALRPGKQGENRWETKGGASHRVPLTTRDRLGSGGISTTREFLHCREMDLLWL